MTRPEIYFSIDIEADGPIPGPYSMLSFAAVAFQINNHEMIKLGDFSANLDRLPNATQHPDTMKFWSRFPEAYKISREDTIVPLSAMSNLKEWISIMSGENRPVMVEYPGDYDFMWIYWYFFSYLGNCPFGFCGYSIKSYANAVLKHRHFHSTNKRDMPKEWFDPNLKHTHVALDDALEQAYIFVEMRKANLKNG